MQLYKVVTSCPSPTRPRSARRLSGPSLGECEENGDTEIRSLITVEIRQGNAEQRKIKRSESGQQRRRSKIVEIKQAE